MSGKLKKIFSRRLKLLRMGYGRFTRHFNNAIRAGQTVLSVITPVAALMCLICMTVYFGFDHRPDDARRLLHMMRIAQGIFIFNVLYSLILSFRATVRSNRIVKWIVDMAMLVTFLTIIYPRPDKPWTPVLDSILYSHIFLFAVLAAYSVVELCYALMRITSRRTNPSLLMSGSFLFFILIGSFVLMLPRCTLVPLSYTDSLFVATSAVCITGLTPVDIASTFTPSGLLVLALLMQIGGLGVLTFTSFFALFFSGSASVYNQLLIRDLIYSKTMNALIPTLLYILGFTLVIEAAGAAAIYMAIPDSLGLEGSDKVIFAAFHSLSSFCNAGFSCLPDGMANPALMTDGLSVYLVTSVLIFAGAIGFPILVNFKEIAAGQLRKLWGRLRHRTVNVPLHLFDLNTKLVLVTSLGILAFSAVAFFVLEYNNTLAGMSLQQKLVQSLFNSLTPRSAGFVSVNPADFMSLTLFLVVIQMWIGGSSQSLGGGVKVNTLAAIYLNVRSVVTGQRRAMAFGRMISIGSIRRANAVVVLAIGAFIIFTVAELILEPAMALKPLLFEVTSALFTVGSSLGATASLCDASKITLCLAMFVGRVGIISLLAGLAGSRRDKSQYFPEENIIIN